MANPDITNYDNSTLFKIDCRFVDRSVEVPAGETLAEGTVLGNITASAETNQGALGGFDTTKTNGLETPVLVLAQELDNSAGGSAELFDNVRVCPKGQVDGAELAFVGSDDLTTLISGKTVKDVLLTEGIIVRDYRDTTFLDNQ